MIGNGTPLNDIALYFYFWNGIWENGNGTSWNEILGVWVSVTSLNGVALCSYSCSCCESICYKKIMSIINYFGNLPAWVSE